MNDLYHPSRGVFYTPFNLSTSKLERLCLIEWQNGQKYKGLEVQYIDNAENGRGVLVILQSLDDGVNVFHEPSLRMDPQGYAIGAGLRQFVQTPFGRSRFEIGPHGAVLDIAFRDADGAEVNIQIQEGGPKPPWFFSLLAPMGSAIRTPEYMPLFLMSQFAFVRRRNTRIAVRFGREEANVIRFPFPMGGERVYYARYCADPFIVFWNKKFEGRLEPLHPQGSGLFARDGDEYELIERDGHFEIAAHIVRSARHTARIAFDPPFPAVTGLADGAQLGGAFTISADPQHGRINGVYGAARQGDEVTLRLHPSGGWTPAGQGWLLRLIFNMGKVFRSWPKTYEWTARLRLEGEQVHLQARWSRIS
jgi:hypothetical protein